MESIANYLIFEQGDESARKRRSLPLRELLSVYTKKLNSKRDVSEENFSPFDFREQEETKMHGPYVSHVIHIRFN